MDTKKMQETGSKIQKVGCALTLLITLPIVGFFAFGVPGAIVGVLIGLIVFAGIFGNGKDKPKEEEKVKEN